MKKFVLFVSIVVALLIIAGSSELTHAVDIAIEQVGQPPRIEEFHVPTVQLEEDDFVYLPETQMQSSEQPELLDVKRSLLEPLPVEISENGRWRAEDFVMQFQSLYGLGFSNEDGTYSDFSLNLLDTRPLVLYVFQTPPPLGIFYDRFGLRIEDVPFIIDNDMVAMSFSLFDLGNDGNPDIVIRWQVPNTCMIREELFRLIEDPDTGKTAYKSMGFLYLWGFSLFHDSDGQLVVLYDSVKYDVYAYFYLTFTDDGIVHIPADMNANTPLAPILPLTDLQEEIVSHIQEHILPFPQGLYIHEATEALLSRFYTFHEFNYNVVHDSDFENGTWLVIWADTTLRDISLIRLGHDILEDGNLILIPAGVYGAVDELPPGEGFVIVGYFGMGTLPWSGISFVDENNITRYFFMQDNRRGYPHDLAFGLFEFPDSTAELPADWQPWWEQE